MKQLRTPLSPQWSYLRERLADVILHAGWAGAVGAALLVIAIAFGFATQGDIEARREALAAERAQLTRSDGHKVERLSDRQRLQACYANFPPAADLPTSLGRLHGYALARGVELQRAEYRSAAESGTPLQRITLDLPVQGQFAPVYHWLDDVLREMPEVAVEAITLKRAATTSTAVDAEVRLQIYVRGKA